MAGSPIVALPDAILEQVSAAASEAESFSRAFLACACVWGLLSAAVSMCQWGAVLRRFRSDAISARRGRGPAASQAAVRLGDGHTEHQGAAPPACHAVPGPHDAAGITSFLGNAAARTLLGWMAATAWGTLLTAPWLWRPWLELLGRFASLAWPALLLVAVAWGLSASSAAALMLIRQGGSASLMDKAHPASICNRRCGWASAGARVLDTWERRRLAAPTPCVAPLPAAEAWAKRLRSQSPSPDLLAFLLLDATRPRLLP